MIIKIRKVVTLELTVSVHPTMTEGDILVQASKMPESKWNVADSTLVIPSSDGSHD